LFYLADAKHQAGGNLTRIADFSLTPVIDINWLVRLFWALFEAMIAMSLPQQVGCLWWTWWEEKVKLMMVAFRSKPFDSLPRSCYHTRDVAQLGRVAGGLRGVKK
jgi:hypothetical protein